MNSDKLGHSSKSTEVQVQKGRHSPTNLLTMMEKHQPRRQHLLKLKMQVNQSRKEVKRQEKLKVPNFAGIVPLIRLFQQNVFMFGDLCQDTLPTEHHAPLATRVCSSPAGPLGILQQHMGKLWSHTQGSRGHLVHVSNWGNDGNSSGPQCSAL